jgi:4-amino-4-deoxy-L-arabinose transferase-like glycosyltransferase
MTKQLEKSGQWLAERPNLLMILTLTAAAFMRLPLMTVRWINPDEGAHLLDGRLVWQGLQPVIDYASRQPFYAYILALFIKLFGVSLNAGRLMPLLASLGIGWIVYHIGARLYDPLRGWLAAAVYLFLPFTLVWSTVVKTEMPAVLLSCLSAWFLLKALREKGIWSYYILSGIMAALAYYVRQSTLYMPLATALFLLFNGGLQVRSRWRALALYVAGYLAICLLTALYYWGPLSGKELLFSQINPLNLVWNRLAHTLGILPPQQRVVDSEGFRILDQDPAYTLSAWRDSILFALFIIAAVLGSLRRSRGAAKDPVRGFLWLWLVILLLAYAFQSASRGFYTQYFLEAMPALVLLAAAALPEAIRPADRLRQVILPVVLFGVVFIFFRLTWQLPISWPVVVALGIAAALLLAGWRAWRRRPLQPATLLMAAALFVSAAWSGRLITPKYECVWSPHTLAKVEKLLKKEGKPADIVLSGAMVWTYAAGMQPFDNVSHPTLFFMKYDAGFEARFSANPPAFIILDGYTQKKFNRYWPFLENSLKEHYYRVGLVCGSKWTVEIWRLQESPAAPDPELAEGGCGAAGTGVAGERI